MFNQLYQRVKLFSPAHVVLLVCRIAPDPDVGDGVTVLPE